MSAGVGEGALLYVSILFVCLFGTFVMTEHLFRPYLFHDPSASPGRQLFRRADRKADASSSSVLLSLSSLGLQQLLIVVLSQAFRFLSEKSFLLCLSRAPKSMFSLVAIKINIFYHDVQISPSFLHLISFFFNTRRCRANVILEAAQQEKE